MGVTADSLVLGNMVLVVFLSKLFQLFRKIRALFNLCPFLLSVIWAQQILEICRWLLHELYPITSISESDMYSKAAGAGDPAPDAWGSWILQGLRYGYGMAPEVCIFQGVFLDDIWFVPMVWMLVCDWSTLGVFCFSFIWKQLISRPLRPLQEDNQISVIRRFTSDLKWQCACEKSIIMEAKKVQYFIS